MLMILLSFFDVDAVRFFVLHEMPFENDGIISWELLVERINSELANTLGNLVNRTVAMINKYFGGVVADKGVGAEVDESLKQVVTSAVAKVDDCMSRFRVADALTEIFNLFKRCNKYIDETTPWILAKSEADSDRLSTVLYNLIEGILTGASLLEAYMPDTSKKIYDQIGFRAKTHDECASWGVYPTGNKVTDKPEILFERLDLEKVMEKVEEIMPKPVEEVKYPKVEPKPEITIDDFDKLQIRVGEVLECEKVPKAKKLLCSKIRVGDEVRQIVSGISKYYSPEEFVGKKVAVITNLKPAVICGIESQGMVLCAMDDQDNLSVMTVDKDIISGSEIG